VAFSIGSCVGSIGEGCETNVVCFGNTDGLYRCRAASEPRITERTAGLSGRCLGQGYACFSAGKRLWPDAGRRGLSSAKDRIALMQSRLGGQAMDAAIIEEEIQYL